MEFEIFANHAHVFPENVWPEGTPDSLHRVMDSCGIAKAVCFATFPRQLKQENEETNLWLHKQIKNDDRLYGFGVVDFEKPDLAGQVRRIADLGFKGIKIHPAFQRIDVLGDNAFEVYAEAEKLGLFLSFHTGVHWYRIRDYQVVKFDEVAFHFPKLRFSMEHIGGYSFFNEGLAVMYNNKRTGEPIRVYGGLTSIYYTDTDPAWYLDDEKLNALFLQMGDEAEIFGLDFPYHGVEQINIALDRIRALPLSDESKQKILGGNLKRALNLD